MGRLRLVVLAIAALAVLGIVAAGCGSSSGGGGGSSSSSAPPSTPTIVVYDTPWTVYTSLDPGKEYWNNVYQYSVYQTLTQSDASSPELVKPCLATSWEPSEGGKVWTFKLREGVKFHGGDTFDSADVVFSFDRNQKLAAGAYGFIYAGYKGITAPDKYTVEITFDSPVPMPGIAAACNNSFIYSQQAFEKDGEKCFEPGTETAGSGPYVTTKVTTTEITYERFPDYWGGWEGTHAKAPDVAVIRKVDEAAVRIQQVQAGDAQMAAGIPVDSAESLKSDANVKLVTGKWWRSTQFFLNTKTQATKDIHLREALFYAFPYEQVQSLAYKGMSSLLSGPLNVTQPGNELQDSTLGIPKQDMAKAKAALQQSAYPNGGVKLLCRVDAGMQDNMQVAQLFKAALQELNITLDVRYVAGSVAYADALSENPPQAMYIVEWSAFYPGCANYLQMWELSTSGYNLTYHKDAKTDSLIAQALAAEATSIDESAKLCVEAAKAYAAGYPYIWAADPEYRVALTKNITWSGYDPLFAYTVDFYNVQVD
jgi:peptide/nickel transport system substrate-binding protein